MNTLNDSSPTVPVTVVIPIYGGLEATRKCLESVAGSALPDNASVTLINDHSPEADLQAYCRELADRAGFNLIVNEVNLGFVRTANKGFTLDPEADVILLNSDTIASEHWIQRLQCCAYQDDAIGTVTPFSNNGTICSYPVFPLSNELPEKWSTAELDRVFQLANAGTYIEIPTAVGFCMYIKRSCLNETGTFDEENFGQGYGEECDFSLRASGLGWKHVIAADVFVYHEGGASFASQSQGRKRLADTIMADLHPQYNELISDFLRDDPLYAFRSNVDAQRIKEQPAEIITVLEEHRQYSQSISERMSAERSAAVADRKQRKLLDTALGKAEAMLSRLETELSESRQQFAETDKALTDAQTIVRTAQTQLEEQQIVVEDLSRDLHQAVGKLHDAKVHAENLAKQITLMEQSRSWRYTAFMRQKR